MGVSAGSGQHVVRAGETLFSIGRLYGVNPYTIASHNGLANPNLIWVGQVLRIPGASGQPGAYVPSSSSRGPTRPSSVFVQPPASAPVAAPVCYGTSGCYNSQATAICMDNTCSCTYFLELACAEHGGVKQFLKPTGSFVSVRRGQAPARVSPPVSQFSFIVADHPICDCSYNRYDCMDLGSGAQSCLEYCLRTRGFDVHQLDRDHDGVACEEW